MGRRTGEEAPAAPVPALRRGDDHDRDEREENEHHRHHEEHAEAVSERRREAPPRPPARTLGGSAIALRDSTAARGCAARISPPRSAASTSTCAPARCAILTSDDLLSSAVPEKDDDDASMTSPRVNLGAAAIAAVMISSPSFVGGDALGRRAVGRTRRRHASARAVTTLDLERGLARPAAVGRLAFSSRGARRRGASGKGRAASQWWGEGQVVFWRRRGPCASRYAARRVTGRPRSRARRRAPRASTPSGTGRSSTPVAITTEAGDGTRGAPRRPRRSRRTSPGPATTTIAR